MLKDTVEDEDEENFEESEEEDNEEEPEYEGIGRSNFFGNEDEQIEEEFLQAE